MFVLLSSIFRLLLIYTLQNHVLVDKLKQMNAKISLILWIQDFFFFVKPNTKGKGTKWVVRSDFNKYWIASGLDVCYQHL